MARHGLQGRTGWRAGLRLGLTSVLLALLLGGCAGELEADEDEELSALQLQAQGALPAADKEQLRTVTAHALEGTLSTQDRAWLAERPEIARGIPDPSLTESGETIEAEGTEAIFGDTSATVGKQTFETTAAAAKTKCRISNRYQKVYGNIRDHLFDYHTRVGWCYNGTKITKVKFSYGYFDNIDSWIDVLDDDTIDKVITIDSKRKQTDNKGKARYCVLRYGCTDTYYPHNKVTFDARGSTHLWWDN